MSNCLFISVSLKSIFFLQITFPMNGPGQKAAQVEEDTSSEQIDQEMEEIHNECYSQLSDNVQAMAESMGVSSGSIMNIEVLLLVMQS